MSINLYFINILLFTLVKVDMPCVRSSVIYHNYDYINTKDADLNYIDPLEYTPQLSSKEEQDTLKEIDDMLYLGSQGTHPNKLLSFETHDHFDGGIPELRTRSNLNPNTYDICTPSGGQGGDNSGNQGTEYSTTPNPRDQEPLKPQQQPQDTKPTNNDQDGIEHVNNHLRTLRAHANAILDELNELESELMGDIEKNDKYGKVSSNGNATSNGGNGNDNGNGNDSANGNSTTHSTSDNCIPGLFNEIKDLATIKSDNRLDNANQLKNQPIQTANKQEQQQLQQFQVQNEFQQKLQQQQTLQPNVKHYLENQQPEQTYQLQQFYHQTIQQPPFKQDQQPQDQPKAQSQQSHQPILITEWGIPLKTNPHTAFLAQAQEAVRNWKEQIDSCKRLLDSTVALESSTKENVVANGFAPLKSIRVELQQAPISISHFDNKHQTYNDVLQNSLTTASQEEQWKHTLKGIDNDEIIENSSVPNKENVKSAMAKQKNEKKYLEIYDMMRYKPSLKGSQSTKSNYPMIQMKFNK